MPTPSQNTRYGSPPTSVPNRIARVAIVGTGFVGSTTAYVLLISGTALEIVLVDRDKKRAEGHVHDLRDAEVFSHAARVFAGDFSDCCLDDVIIITVGARRSSGMKSRLDNLKESASMLKGIVEDVVRHNPCGMLLIASNPVDVLTCLPASRVIGSGTTLDTSRFRRRLTERYGVAADDRARLHHRRAWRQPGGGAVSARIAGMPLEGFAKSCAALR